MPLVSTRATGVGKARKKALPLPPPPANAVIPTVTTVSDKKDTGVAPRAPRPAERNVTAATAVDDAKRTDLVATDGGHRLSLPLDESQRVRPYQHHHQHHAAMLESMDRKARELCDDTRRQYELLTARLEAQHDWQLQALQHKLREVVGASVPLGEHRQLLTELARTHERETRALVVAHDHETAALRVRCTQLANEQQLRRNRAFQDEKDELVAVMTHLEMDRNAALRQWREEELAVLGVQKALEDERHAHALTRTQLQEACQHLVTLKAQLSKLDRVRAKLKDERAGHAAARTQWEARVAAASDASHALSARTSVLEAELLHVRAVSTAQQEELASLKAALASREAQASELQRALAESAAKETLQREFRESERVAFEQQRSAWRDAQTRLERQESDAQREAATRQQEKQALEAQSQRLLQDAARHATEHEQRVAALEEQLRRARAKYAAAKQRVAQLEHVHAEQQEEARVDDLLFASSSTAAARHSRRRY